MYDHRTSEIDGHQDAHIRAGDSDRESTAERLRRHHAEGRINMEEFQERLDRCYQATTAGELRELVADLPDDPQPAPRSFYRWRMMPLAAILLVILAITAVTDDGPHPFLFVLPLFFLARFFLFRRHVWSIRGPRFRAGRQA